MTYGVCRICKCYASTIDEGVCEECGDMCLDKLYEKFDKMMWEGKYIEMDEMLSTMYPDNLSITVMLGVLTSTLPVKSRLTNRPAFFEMVKAEITARGNMEDQLLEGLE